MTRHTTIAAVDSVDSVDSLASAADMPAIDSDTATRRHLIRSDEAADAGASANASGASMADDLAIMHRAHAALEAVDAEQRAIEVRQQAAGERLEALAAQDQAIERRVAAARRAHEASVQAAAERAVHLALATAGTTEATMLRDHLTRLEAERAAAERDLAAAEHTAERDRAEIAAEDGRILAEQQRDALRLTEIVSERETFVRVGAEALERVGVATEAEVEAELAAQQARILAIQGELEAAEASLRHTRDRSVERLAAWPERAAAYKPKRRRATLGDLAQRWYALATWLEDYGHEVARSTEASDAALQLLQGAKLDEAFALTNMDLRGLLTRAILDDRQSWSHPDPRFAGWRHKVEVARRCAQTTPEG